MTGMVPRLKDFHVSHRTGFLLEDPLETLPRYFQPWMDIGMEVGPLVGRKQLREVIQKMPLLDSTKLEGHKQLRLANLVLSVINSGYIWQEGDNGVPGEVPAQLAVPMCYVAGQLGLPVIATHAAVCNANWALVDRNGAMELSNLRSICLFPGELQCSWFFKVTAMVEYSAVAGIKAIERAQIAVLSGDTDVITESLGIIRSAIDIMKSYLVRMFENLTTETFYNVVRPYLSGWGGTSSPAPDGIVFEGVSSQPKKAIGGSAAQSPPLQCFDAILGIEHSPERQEFLRKMREYMLPSHARYIEAISHGPSVRTFVQNCDNGELQDAYQKTVQALTNLRTYHIQLTTRYIVLPASRKKSEQFEAVSKVGTGGTELIPFLKSIRNSTKSFQTLT